MCVLCLESCERIGVSWCCHEISESIQNQKTGRKVVVSISPLPVWFSGLHRHVKTGQLSRGGQRSLHGEAETLKIIGGEARKQSNGVVEGGNTGKKRCPRCSPDASFSTIVTYPTMLSVLRTRVLSINNRFPGTFGVLVRIEISIEEEGAGQHEAVLGCTQPIMEGFMERQNTVSCVPHWTFTPCRRRSSVSSNSSQSWWRIAVDY